MRRWLMLCLILLCWPAADSSAGDLSESFSRKIKFRHFVFHYTDEFKDIETVRDVSDGFIDTVNRDFFPARFDFPINVYILPDADAFEDVLSREFGMANTAGLYGIYLPQIHGLMTYGQSGYGTFTHEIMHPLLQENFPRLPVWAAEGIPAFFEKFFGYWQDGRLVLRFGFQNPWRIKELGRRLAALDLEAIMKFPAAHDTSEKRMVSVFLYRNGKLRRYIELMKSQDRKGFKTLLEAAFEKPVAEILPLWDKYLEEVGRDKDRILRIPPSRVFETRAQFDEFIASLGLDEGGGS